MLVPEGREYLKGNETHALIEQARRIVFCVVAGGDGLHLGEPVALAADIFAEGSKYRAPRAAAVEALFYAGDVNFAICATDSFRRCQPRGNVLQYSR